MNTMGRKKVIAYGLVLAAALIGLVVDRLGRTPDNTAALAPGGPALPRAGALRVADHTSVKGPAIARVFKAISQTGDDAQAGRGGTPVRNAFQMAPTMRTFYEAGGPNRQAREQQKIQSEQERLRQEISNFQSAHKLRGTTLQEGLSWAIVDDSVVRLGEKIDGFELKSVERYRAQFVRGDATVILSLPFP